MFNLKTIAAISVPIATAFITYWTISWHYKARMQSLRAELTEAAAEQRAELEARTAREKAVCQIVKEEYGKAITTANNNSADIHRLLKQLQSSPCCTMSGTETTATRADGTACCRLLTEIAELATKSADAADRNAAKLEGLQRWARAVSKQAVPVTD